MTWYCGHCEYMNSTNDLFCCHCHRLKDNLAFKDGELPTIPTLAGSLTPHSNDYNTYGDYDQEHHKATSSSRLEIDAAFCDPTSTPAQDPQDPQDPHEGKWRWFWYCCNCGDGPHGVGSIPACSQSHCSHVQCANCAVIRLKKKVKSSD